MHAEAVKELVAAAELAALEMPKTLISRQRLIRAAAAVKATEEKPQTHSFAPSDWGATGEHCRVCSEPFNAPIHQTGGKL
jgi:hypothetical protein